MTTITPSSHRQLNRQPRVLHLLNPIPAKGTSPSMAIKETETTCRHGKMAISSFRPWRGIVPTRLSWSILWDKSTWKHGQIIQMSLQSCGRHYRGKKVGIRWSMSCTELSILADAYHLPSRRTSVITHLISFTPRTLEIIRLHTTISKRDCSWTTVRSMQETSPHVTSLVLGSVIPPSMYNPLNFIADISIRVSSSLRWGAFHMRRDHHLLLPHQNHLNQTRLIPCLLISARSQASFTPTSIRRPPPPSPRRPSQLPSHTPQQVALPAGILLFGTFWSRRL